LPADIRGQWAEFIEPAIPEQLKEKPLDPKAIETARQILQGGI